VLNKLSMVAPTWSFEDAKQHFFIYTERTDTTDLVHELRTSPIVAHGDVNRVASTLYQNVRATAFAASAPYYTALMGTANGRTAAIQELLERSRDNRDRGAFMSAIALLQDSGAFIGQSFEPLRLVHTNSAMNVMSDAFHALMRQATAMLWGAFEAYCYDLYRLLFMRKLPLLRAVAAAFAPGAPGVPGTPWGQHPKKLADHIDAEALKVPPVAAGDAFDWYADNKNLPSMNLGAIRFFACVMFASDPALLALLNATDVTKLAARRHLILHAAGVVDQNYVTSSGESLPLGTNLVVTPRELALGFRAISAAAAALANAASAAL
jgi:hypothetical protein